MGMSCTKTITKSAVTAALILAATLISIPAPITGYMNLGDVFVLVGGSVLGPVYGAVAAAVGSSLADIFLGYAYYAPATFVIKALMAAIAAFFYKKAKNKTGIIPFLGMLISELIMVFGYYLFYAVFLGTFASASATIFPNAVQGGVCMVCAYLLIGIISKNKIKL